MVRFTRLLAFALAFAVAVTSQQMAMARGMTTDAAGQVILCTGQGVVTVTLDAEGNPMGPVHICPDCALSFLDAAGAPATVAAPVVHMQKLAQTYVSALQSPIVHSDVNVRGPPLSV